MTSDHRACLATSHGLVVVDAAGVVLERHFEDQEVTAVDVGDGGRRMAAAVTGAGVQHRAGGAWEGLGLDGETIWTVALAPGGEVLAGLEPAALWRLGRGSPAEIDLSQLPNRGFWHSPWGPADVGAVVVEGDRIVVGIEVGGIAVSSDGGDTWEARNDGLYEDVHHVACDGDRLFATTGMGFHRSHDGGATWAWENDGIDRGYTQGLALCGRRLVMSSSSPPPLWEADGPDAALFVAEVADGPLRWRVAHEGFAGNVGRQSLRAAGPLVVAGTTTGELIVSVDGGTSFATVRDDLPPIAAVALAPAADAPGTPGAPGRDR